MEMNTLKEKIKTLIIRLYPDYRKKRLKDFFDQLRLNEDSNEEKELLLLRFWLKADSVFFDIGANNGLYTYVAELYTQPENIYVFEPIPELSDRLNYMFSSSKHFRMALSNDRSIKKFKIPIIGIHEFKSRGTLNTTYKEKGEVNTRIIEVKTIPLDEFCKENKIDRINFVKIDVEGHEFDVVKGARETFKKLRPVLQIEIEQRHHSEKIDKIIDYVNEIGYKCHYLDLQSRQIVPLNTRADQIQHENEFKKSGYVNNFLFLPDQPEWTGKLAKINQEILKM